MLYKVIMVSKDKHTCELNLPINEDENIVDVIHQSIETLGWGQYGYEIKEIREMKEMKEIKCNAK